MAITTIYTYPLNGTQRDFTIPFEYLARRFVVLTLIGTDRKELVLTTDYRFTSKTNVQTIVPWGPADGYERIEIRRNTSATERLVDFADGSILRASELNTSQVQTLHVAEEARNMVADTIATNQDGDLDARGRRLVNLADAVGPDHAVTLRQEQAWAQSTLGNRNAAEVARAGAEQARDVAITNRGQAETLRGQAEAAKDIAEAARDQSVAAAGTISNNVTLAQQARDQAETARDTTLIAAQSVQGVNIPSAFGNAMKWLRQKADESGFEYVEAYTKGVIDSLLSTISGQIENVVSRLGAIELWPIQKRRVSPLFDVALGTVIDWEHGLSDRPVQSRVIAVCVIADGVYSPGAEMTLGSYMDPTGAGVGYQEVLTPTLVTLRFGSYAIFTIRTGSTVGYATVGRWKVRLEVTGK